MNGKYKNTEVYIGFRVFYYIQVVKTFYILVAKVDHCSYPVLFGHRGHGFSKHSQAEYPSHYPFDSEGLAPNRTNDPMTSHCRAAWPRMYP